jgi:hypothetical protein
MTSPVVFGGLCSYAEAVSEEGDTSKGGMIHGAEQATRA